MRPLIALAVDLGGSHANCAIVQERKEVRSRTIATSGNDGLMAVLALVSVALRELAAQEAMSLTDIRGLDVGFCGLVDRRQGRVTASSGKYEDAPARDLPGWARNELGLRLVLENYTRMTLFGDRYAGEQLRDSTTWPW
jgi:glucokinase